MIPVTGFHYAPLPDYLPFVVLDRIVTEDDKPDYCIHGRTCCMGCLSWVWLGDKSCAAILAGEVRPLCKQCALANLTPETVKLDNVGDHRRADGPH